MLEKIAACAAWMALPIALAAQNPPPVPPPKAVEQKVVHAVRTASPVVIDGRLTEDVWQSPSAEGFTQNDPQDGAPATETTRVWVAYDDKNLYVAAACLDSDPKGIIGRLERRDTVLPAEFPRGDSDWFYFYVDPSYDKRTGFGFGVNPAGAIMDETLSNDGLEDPTWDADWEGRATVDEKGWSVEMKIPFNQLRFPKKDEYVWGVNFVRVIKRKNERDAFAWVAKNVSAFVSRFARLEGIAGIHPGRHIEWTPYAVGKARYRGAEPGNPFQTGQSYSGNAGFDLKLGLKSDLTLDATVNPDFGQVEVDPAVINLSAYETFYEEKRPFFIEGASIFNGFGKGGIHIDADINWPNPRFFYSRRIGRPPQGFVLQDGFVDFPDYTKIIGAAKVTGKLGGWNVGFVNGLTSREFAEISAPAGDRSQEEVEPFTYYGALRAQKDFNDGQQGLGFMATGVLRNLRNDSLSGILNKDAFTLAVDGWTFLDKERNWVFGGWAGGTRVDGTRGDILSLQTSSLHYYQRPDVGYLGVDPEATSLSGWGGHLTLGKQGGNFLFLTSVGVLSPGFDPNDLGYQSSGSDKINLQILPGYSWTKPGKVFNQVLIFGGVFRNYDFGGNKIWDGALISIQGTFVNFWQFNTMFACNPSTFSNTLTRGGPLARVPWGWQYNQQLSTDSRRPFVLEIQNYIYTRPDFSHEWNAQITLRWKPRSNFSLSIGPSYYAGTDPEQWVTRIDDSLMASTYGTRYVFGDIDQKVISADLRLDWTFTPRLTLQAYVQPFVGVGAYRQFKELARPRSTDFNVYGQGASTVAFSGGVYTIDPDGAGPAAPFAFGNPDFNVKSLRGTVVLRWEYLPGSLLYFVWTQNRAGYAHPGDLQLGRDLGELLTAPGDNIFMLKFTYRWNL